MDVKLSMNQLVHSNKSFNEEVMIVKKILLFSISFVLVFLFLQLFSGMFFTLTYSPDIGNGMGGSNLSHQTDIIIRKQSVMPLILMAVLASPIAFLIMSKLTRATGNE